jgi:hypothetical protein
MIPAAWAAAVARLALTLLLLLTTAHAGVTVTPSTLTNDFVGTCTLNISGLDSNGETVVIKEYMDTDNSGTITAGDVLVRKFKITDGQVTKIGLQRNLNVPGDEDGAADSQIQTKIYFSPSDIVSRNDVRYIFQVAPNGTGFTPFTTNLTITQKDYGGSGIAGSVTANSTPKAGALVVFLQQKQGDYNFVGITHTDGSGNYSFKAPAGTYLVAAAAPGFVCNSGTAPVPTVVAGSFSNSQNVTLTPSTRTISGTVRDSSTLAGLPAIPIQGQSNSGYVSITFADGSGNYSVDATAEPWKLGLDDWGLAQLGYIPQKDFTEGSTTSVTGFNLGINQATALIYGSLTTPGSVAVPFAEVNGVNNGTPSYHTSGITDANGNYTLGVLPGSWQDMTSPTGYLVLQPTVVVNAAGNTVQQNLVAYPVTAHLQGQLRDNHNNILANVPLLARDPTLSNGNEINATTTTDSNGNFDLGVYGGGGSATKTWEVDLFLTGGSPPSYVSTNPQFQVQDSVNVTGINLVFYVVTAHLNGQVLDENNAPIGNINIWASGGTNGQFFSSSNTDSGGNFDIPVFAGSWYLGLSNITGLGLLPQDMVLSVADNVDQNGLVFRAYHTSTTITGSIKNGSNAGVGGISVTATNTTNGAGFSTSAVTDASGNYTINVFSGNWAVQPSTADLAANGGYAPINSQNVFVNTTPQTVNFTASSSSTSSFTAWQNTYFTPTELQNASISGPTAVYAGDGMTNLLKCALNLSPKMPGTAGLPTAGTLPVNGGQGPFVTLTYTQLLNASHLQYVVQESTDLVSWTNSTVSGTDVLATTATTQSLRAKVLMGAAGRKFLRLQVTSN